MDIEKLIVLDPRDALASIIDNGCPFSDILEVVKTNTEVLNVLSVVSDVVSLETNASDVIKVLTAVNTEEFFDQISENFRNFNRQEAEKCSKLIICIVTRISLRMPNAAVRTLGILKTIQENLKGSINHTSPDDEESLEKFHDLCDEIQELTKSIIHYAVQSQRAKAQKKTDVRKPPDDFRNIPILPRTDDIFIPGCGKPFLRKNIALGSYEDLHHYLDVQFRLFREDCISQLRSGIMEYIEQKQISGENRVHRLQDARLYRKAKILNAEMTLEGRLHTIQLDKYHATKIKWDRGSRLIYGSLVCLSPDDFQTLYFGVVLDSDRKILKEQHTFKVELSQEEGVPPIRMNLSVSIVECSTFFEAYRHVLRCLQRIQPGQLPFERYIVDCKTNVFKPSYLMRESKCHYDFYPNMEGKHIFDEPMTQPSQKIEPRFLFRISLSRERSEDERGEKYKFNINNDEWPSAEDLHLDVSQYKAFKAALSHEFALIQGPPGTGKTYLGLQIAKALLRNREYWIRGSTSKSPRPLPSPKQYPMLVVCYTNHALDQFMEGIINFMNINPDSSRARTVVRVGGRCENAAVSEFSLKNLRFRQKKFIDYRQHKESMESAYRQLLRYRFMCQERRGAIFSITILDIPKERREIFSTDEELLQWLGISNEAWMESLCHILQRGSNRNTTKESAIMGSDQEVSMKDNADQPDVDVETEDQKAKSDRMIETEEFDDLSRAEKEAFTFWIDINDFCTSLISKHDHDLSQEAKSELEKIGTSFIKKASDTDEMSAEEANLALKRIESGDLLKSKDRWRLYRHLATKTKNNLQELLRKGEMEYETVFERYNREKQRVDEEILKQATVIAMTTTGASRYQEILTEVSPRIVIVEEAAEVLEAHIIASINPHCEHLILIGDHRQLEPKPAVWELALKYNLSLSMFERMIKNGLGFHKLECQHRMRPEISQLVRPIYDHLTDNDNVLQYPHVKGIQHDVVFLNHRFPEEFNDDVRSYRNVFEAQYTKRLSKYLLQQGYSPSQITILTPYTSQMFCLQDCKPHLRGIKICVLDNFQGEENDIIILSLVRSNEEGKIGFLDKENRICVALSRAKIALFVVGNIDNLCRYSRKSNLWRKAVEYLTEERVSDGIQLYCQNHPSTKFLAKLPSDFDMAPDGGCQLPCDFRLGCGHACMFFCHPYNRDHSEYDCEKTCRLRCEHDHVCSKKCHHPEPCYCSIILLKTLPCGHQENVMCHIDPEKLRCTFQVKKDLPYCDHTAEMPCYLDPREYECGVVVTRILSCQHEVDLECHIDTYKYKCKVIVSRRLPCDHVKDLQCHVNMERYACLEIMTKTLPCGHNAEMECYKNPEKQVYVCKETVTEKRKDCEHFFSHQCHDKLYNFLHSCKEPVEVKRLYCEHQYKLECTEYRRMKKLESGSAFTAFKWGSIENKVGPCKELVTKEWDCHHPGKEMECSLLKGARCKEKCGTKCKREHRCEEECHFPSKCKCTVKVKKILPGCGHSQTMMCHQKKKSFQCKAYVEKTLPSCGHTAMLECSSLTENVMCQTQVTKHLPCGHKKEMKCSDSVNDVGCIELVERTLTCNHKKLVECHLVYPFDGIHCEEEVSKILQCGHEKRMACFASVEEVECKEKMYKTLSCNHQVLEFCHIPSSRIECKALIEVRHVECDHMISLPCPYAQRLLQPTSKDKEQLPDCKKEIDVLWDCGHEEKLPCYMSKKKTCKRKCASILECGHNCEGNCESCSDRDLHKGCLKRCEKELICGQKCSSTSCSISSLCERRCEKQCTHGKCDLACFMPCRPCDQPCSWTCPHLQCQKSCGEECERIRCNERCLSRLPCGHACIGYCADPCPILCRRCNRDILAKVANRNVNKVIFVQLTDCGHMFDGKKLDSLVDTMVGDFQRLVCPTCSSPVRHPRYRKALQAQQRMINEAKLQLLFMADQQQRRSFPMFSDSLKTCQNYLKEFSTFLLIYKKQFQRTNAKVLSRMERTRNHLYNFLENIIKNEQPTIQNYIDTHTSLQKVSASWQVGILLSLTSVFEEGDDTPDAECGEDKEDTEKPVNLKLKNMSLQFLQDNVSRIETIIIKSKPCNKAALKEIESDIDQVVEILGEFDGCRNLKASIVQARRCPHMPFVMDPHKQYWDICDKGHVYCHVGELTDCRQCCCVEYANELENFRQRVVSGDYELAPPKGSSRSGSRTKPSQINPSKEGPQSREQSAEYIHSNDDFPNLQTISHGRGGRRPSRGNEGRGRGRGRGRGKTAWREMTFDDLSYSRIESSSSHTYNSRREQSLYNRVETDYQSDGYYNTAQPWSGRSGCRGGFGRGQYVGAFSETPPTGDWFNNRGDVLDSSFGRGNRGGGYLGRGSREDGNRDRGDRGGGNRGRGKRGRGNRPPRGTDGGRGFGGRGWGRRN